MNPPWVNLTSDRSLAIIMAGLDQDSIEVDLDEAEVFKNGFDKEKGAFAELKSVKHVMNHLTGLHQRGFSQGERHLGLGRIFNFFAGTTMIWGWLQI